MGKLLGCANTNDAMSASIFSSDKLRTFYMPGCTWHCSVYSVNIVTSP